MGDADDSYNFLEIGQFIEKLREGNDIVIGNRYTNKMEKGAMKPLHKYIGTPILTYIIRKKFDLKIKDINCGLRGGNTKKLQELECKAEGMEFASEMLIKAKQKEFSIAEVPINFYKDKRGKKSHLNTFQDGIKHFKVIIGESLYNQSENKSGEKSRKEAITRTFKKYISLFIITILICIISLVVVTILPKGKIEEHCQQAANIYESKNMQYPEKLRGRRNTTIDNYADSISLSIIYSLDANKPLESILEAKYYENETEAQIKSFERLVNGEVEAQTQYIRYWHGYIIILKPLLMFFNIEQIYFINTIVLAVLILILIKQLWKIDKKVIIALLIGLYIISIPIVTQCFEYTWAFFLTFIISIIVLKIDNGNNNKIFQLMFLTGILTCFFDFLTVELLTVLFPLLMILTKRYKEGKIGKLNEVIRFIMISLLLWGIGYIGMYLAKWIIASIVLRKNCIVEAMEKVQIRINGEIESVEQNKAWIESIKRNVNSLYPIFLITRKYILYILVPIITAISLLICKYNSDKYKTNKINYLVGLLIIALIPYVRYALLIKHSYYHYIFTYRIQLVTVMAFILIMAKGGRFFFSQNFFNYLLAFLTRQEMTMKGFASIDISKYEGQPINIQVVAI